MTYVGKISIGLLRDSRNPYLYSFVIARRGEAPLRSRRPCHSIDPITMACVGEERIPCNSIPYLHLRISACRGNIAPIRRPRHGIHALSMAFISEDIISL